jgi:acetyl esterase/lipase
MQKHFFLFLVFFLLLLSSLNWIIPQNLWMWQLSVLTTEYGHFFALFCLALILFKFVRREPSALIAGFFLSLALSGFLKPLYQLHQNEEQMKYFKWKTLLFGRGFAEVIPTTIDYKDGNEVRQKMDYYPAQGEANGAWILVVHGGGWDSGDLKQLPELNSFLANKGYAVFSMNYRLAPLAKWPAQKEDVEAAVSYVRKNSSSMNLKPELWAILGRSAGAQIAAASAYAFPEAERPKSVFLFYGPTEMTFGYEVGSEKDILESRNLLINFLGGTPYQAAKAYDDASPMNFLSEKTPPTLLLYGEFDRLVWYKHGERLFERLRLLNIPTNFVTMPWATHGFDFNLNGPAGQLSTAMIEKYLTEFVLNQK